MRSFFIAAVSLSLICSSTARVAHSFRDLVQEDAQPQPQLETGYGILKWFKHLFRKDLVERQDVSNSTSICYEDEYYTFVSELPASFCQQYMSYPNVTAVVQYTSTRSGTQRCAADVINTNHEQHLQRRCLHKRANGSGICLRHTYFDIHCHRVPDWDESQTQCRASHYRQSTLPV